MHAGDQPFIEQEPVGFLDDIDITGTGDVLIAPYLFEQRIALLCGQTFSRYRQIYTFKVGQSIGDGLLHLGVIQLLGGNLFAVTGAGGANDLTPTRPWSTR